MSNARLAVIAALILSATATYAADQENVTLENRAGLVAARIARGASYDQATRAVPLPRDARSQAVENEMANGHAYRNARVLAPDVPKRFNNRVQVASTTKDQ